MKIVVWWFNINNKSERLYIKYWIYQLNSLTIKQRTTLTKTQHWEIRVIGLKSSILLQISITGDSQGGVWAIQGVNGGNHIPARHTATCQETTIHQRYIPLHAKKQPYISDTYRYMPIDNHTPAIHTATCQEPTVHQRYIPLNAKKQPYRYMPRNNRTLAIHTATCQETEITTWMWTWLTHLY